MAVHNAYLLDQANERTQQLQRALDSRAVIDQAIGIIRSRSGDDAHAAFERLARISQTENTKLNVVAERWSRRRCGAPAPGTAGAWEITRGN